jgi:TonB family protein
MGNVLLTPTDLEPDKGVRAAQQEPELLRETDGSMWSSLFSNLRDAFSSSKQPPLELTSKPVDQDLIIREEPIWRTLWASIEDLFFPRKLPPLELTSTPIPQKDLLADKRGPMATLSAIGMHAFLIALIALVLFEMRMHLRAIAPKTNLANVDVTPFVPLTPKAKLTMGGGGGGGDRDLVDVSKGKLPKFDKQQISPPQVLRVDHPKIAVEPTIVMPKDVKLPDTNMPNLGLPTSTQVQLASNGTGSGGGMGSGHRGGLGSGEGGGFGPGTGGGYGGGLYHVGGGVLAPQVIYSVDPEFSDEARRAKYQGICVVELVVDAQGNPQRVRVIRLLGMGLDEKAVEAVRQYKFKPAQYQGKAVPVDISVEVNFRIY